MKLAVIILLPALLGISVVQDLREKRRTQEFREQMTARVRVEVLLAIERQDYVDLARMEFPALADHRSPLYMACIERYGALQLAADPLLDRSDWPLTVAREEAARLGLTPTIILRLK